MVLYHNLTYEIYYFGSWNFGIKLLYLFKFDKYFFGIDELSSFLDTSFIFIFAEGFFYFYFLTISSYGQMLC